MFPVSNEFTIYWAANKKFQFVSKNQYPYVCVVGRLNSSFLWCATKKFKFFAELWTRKIVDCWKFDNFFYLFHNVGFPFVSLGLSEFFPSQKNFPSFGTISIAKLAVCGATYPSFLAVDIFMNLNWQAVCGIFRPAFRCCAHLFFS